MTDPQTTGPNIITRGAIIALDEKGVPVARHAEKLRSIWWWLPALVFFILSLTVVGITVSLITRKDHIDLALLITLGVGALLPLLGALFCATQADKEGTNAWLESVFTAGKRAREVVGK